jgi:phosphate:Na+ symporter
MRSEMKSLQETLNQTNREMIKNMQDDKRQDMGSLIHFFTYSQRLKDKISNLHHLLEKELK